MSQTTRTTAFVIVRNTGDRLVQERWASLLTIIGQTVAAGIHAGTVTQGPFTSQPTDAEQAAHWLVTTLNDRVVNLQARLSKIATAYPNVDLIWSETRPRRIVPHPARALDTAAALGELPDPATLGNLTVIPDPDPEQQPYAVQLWGYPVTLAEAPCGSCRNLVRYNLAARVVGHAPDAADPCDAPWPGEPRPDWATAQIEQQQAWAEAMRRGAALLDALMPATQHAPALGLRDQADASPGLTIDVRPDPGLHTHTADSPAGRCSACPPAGVDLSTPGPRA
jgi:hypothetical protein